MADIIVADVKEEFIMLQPRSAVNMSSDTSEAVSLNPQPHPNLHSNVGEEQVPSQNNMDDDLHAEIDRAIQNHGEEEPLIIDDDMLDEIDDEQEDPHNTSRTSNNTHIVTSGLDSMDLPAIDTKDQLSLLSPSAMNLDEESHGQMFTPPSSQSSNDSDKMMQADTPQLKISDIIRKMRNSDSTEQLADEKKPEETMEDTPTNEKSQDKQLKCMEDDRTVSSPNEQDALNKHDHVIEREQSDSKTESSGESLNTNKSDITPFDSESQTEIVVSKDSMIENQADSPDSYQIVRVDTSESDSSDEKSTSDEIQETEDSEKQTIVIEKDDEKEAQKSEKYQKTMIVDNSEGSEDERSSAVKIQETEVGEKQTAKDKEVLVCIYSKQTVAAEKDSETEAQETGKDQDTIIVDSSEESEDEKGQSVEIQETDDSEKQTVAVEGKQTKSNKITSLIDLNYISDSEDGVEEFASDPWSPVKSIGKQDVHSEKCGKQTVVTEEGKENLCTSDTENSTTSIEAQNQAAVKDNETALTENNTDKSNVATGENQLKQTVSLDKEDVEKLQGLNYSDSEDDVEEFASDPWSPIPQPVKDQESQAKTVNNSDTDSCGEDEEEEFADSSPIKVVSDQSPRKDTVQDVICISDGGRPCRA